MGLGSILYEEVLNEDAALSVALVGQVMVDGVMIRNGCVTRMPVSALRGLLQPGGTVFGKGLGVR